MNVDRDSSYVCTAPGCFQRFQREDHLIIHRHKHEMTLRFPAVKCDSTPSDQTPTPTRFLQDCEEVGLFTELELTQSQQTDDTKPSCCVQVSGQNQSHTETEDHQFIQQQCAVTQLKQNTHFHTHCTAKKPSAPSCLHSRQTHSVANTLSGTLMNIEAELSVNSNTIGLPGPSRPSTCPSLQVSKVTPRHSQPAVSNGTQNPLCHMMGMMSSQQQPPSHLQSAPHHHGYRQHGRSQSPQRLTHQHQSQDQSHHSHAHHSPPVHMHPGSSHQTPPPLSHQPIPAQMSSAPEQTHCPQSPPASGGRRRRTTNDPDERRRKFLERNRAAATRCRQKRKVWVTSLERRAEELTHTNLQLQNEVTSLRTEAAQLKQVLLTHKDCPVSVRQRKNTVE